MLLQSIPNPDYMNGTMVMNGATSRSSAVGKDRFGLGSRMNGNHMTGNHMTGNHMTGTMSRSTAADKSRFALDSRTGSSMAMNGVMVRSDTANSKKLALRRSHRGSGMGTTGSLGVSFAAPLTRGGFPGEIFYSPPMPTGHWKDAPSPVMLGTDAASSAAAALLTPNKDDMQKYLIGAAAGLAIGFLAYKLFFSR